MVAARAKSAAPVLVAPVVEPVVEKFGRERFNESCARDAARKPKPANHPELRGRERFAAGVDSTPQILSANVGGEKKELKGRARFNSAVAKDFAAIKK